MNSDQKGFVNFFSVLALAGLLLVLAWGQAVGEEEYDEDTYGPSEKFHHDSCHDEIFQMESGSTEQNDDFTMQALYDGKYCGACHDGQTAFASNTRCTVCHIGVKGYDRMHGGPKTDAHGGHH